MRYMNDFDIDQALLRYAGPGTPNRMVAARAICRLAVWANNNSDGWAYWPKPVRAAAKLMDLLEGDGTNDAFRRLRETDATDAELAAALRPVKAFLTRQGVAHSTIIPT